MYSFALVMWEILRRTEIPHENASAESHALPYFEHVGHDPPVEVMRQVVCVQKQRPQIKTVWMMDEVGSADVADVLPVFFNESACTLAGGTTACRVYGRVLARAAIVKTFSTSPKEVAG